MEIEKVILSKDVRDYLKKQNRKFSDSEMATLIYNSRIDWFEKLNALQEIANSTENEILKNQIEEAIRYEKKRMEKMKSNTGEYIYKLEIWEEADGEYQSAGFFSQYIQVKKYGEKSGRKFSIEKIKLMNETPDWDEDNWGEDSVAYTIHENEHTLLYLVGYEEESGEGYQNSSNRFENAYVKIPHPFRNGDIVRNIITGDIAIVRFVTDESENEPVSEWWDYSDIVIPVEVADANGNFGHMHVEPMYLEYAELKEEDPQKELFEIASYFVQGKAYIQEMQMVCEAYAKKRL